MLAAQPFKAGLFQGPPGLTVSLENPDDHGVDVLVVGEDLLNEAADDLGSQAASHEARFADEIVDPGGRRDLHLLVPVRIVEVAVTLHHSNRRSVQLGGEDLGRLTTVDHARVLLF